jgi:hypothetical protein
MTHDDQIESTQFTMAKPGIDNLPLAFCDYGLMMFADLASSYNAVGSSHYLEKEEEFPLVCTCFCELC